MSLFFAIAKDIAVPHDETERHGRRYLMAFASREAADEWWRQVSDASSGKSETTIKRIEPQFYTYDSSRYEISGTVLDINAAPESRTKVMFTRLPERDSGNLCFIPFKSITDHESPGSFFIRSKVEPHIYWHEMSNGKIAASSKKRSKFLIRIDPPVGRSIMIGKDDILISPIRDSGLFVHSNIGDGGLRLTRNGLSWKFKDFKSRFVSYHPGLKAAGTSDVGNEVQIHAVQLGLGEEWELVH
ncbi:hypothetical protein RU639_013719 [Aspergillus parasiticus]